MSKRKVGCLGYAAAILAVTWVVVFWWGFFSWLPF